MSSSPSVIHVYGDWLDYLLHAYGETQEQWNAPFDAAPILPELSKELYECGLNHHQLDVVKEEIADARLHILIGIFTIIFRNGYHPQRVTRNVYKLAKLYCPESVKKLVSFRSRSADQRHNQRIIHAGACLQRFPGLLNTRPSSSSYRQIR